MITLQYALIFATLTALESLAAADFSKCALQGQRSSDLHAEEVATVWLSMTHEEALGKRLWLSVLCAKHYSI